MKRNRPTERERQIYEWKCKGANISWARWCALMGFRPRHKAPRGLCKPRQRVLMHKRGQRSTTHAKA